MGRFDIFLDGKGYLLMRDAKGRLMDGAAREQAVDPFSSHLTEEKWQTTLFQFGEGAGRKRYDSSERYRWGFGSDTRSKRLILGPQVVFTPGATNAERLDEAIGDPAQVLDRRIYKPGNAALAFQFTAAALKYRSLGVMVRRDPAFNYSGAADFTLEIQGDAAGVPNGVALGTINVPLLWAADEWLPEEDRWLSGDWFWCWASFPAPVLLAAMTPYWLVVTNDQDAPLDWAYDDSTDMWVTMASSLTPAGALWTPFAARRPLVKLYPHTEVDRETNDLCAFRGEDHARRIYAAVGPKVMYYDEATADWLNSKGDFDGKVTDLIEWHGRMLAAQGSSGNFRNFTGASATTDWHEDGSQAYCFCVHDDHIWKALNERVYAGDRSWPIGWKGSGIGVGDPGTPITALCSHEGKLYCAKPEGIFRIDYPAGDYDTWKNGDANPILVLDFSADRAGRPWLVSWESGLYFPSSGGVYEWRGGQLQNIWALYMDSRASALVGNVNGGYRGTWRSCVPTPTGLLLLQQSNYHEVQQLWHYHSGEWVPMARTDPTVDWPDPVFRFGEAAGALFLNSKGGGTGQLYAGVGARIASMVWPTWTDDTTLDTASRYADRAWVTLPTFGLDKPQMTKDWHALRFFSSGFHVPSCPGTIYYRLDEDPTWLAMPTQLGTTPVQTIDFPAGTYSQCIDIEVVMGGLLGPLGLDHTVTPTLESVTLLYQELPETVRQWQYWIVARDEQETRIGGVTGRGVEAVIAEMAALDLLSEPFPLIDEFGTLHPSVRLMGCTRQDTTLRSEVGPKPGLTGEVGFMVTLCEV